MRKLSYLGLPYLLCAMSPLAVLCGNIRDIPPAITLLQTFGWLFLGVLILDLAVRLLLRRAPCPELLSCAVIVFVMAYGYLIPTLFGSSLRPIYGCLLWIALFTGLAIVLLTKARHPILPRITSLLRYLVLSIVIVQVLWLGTLLSDETQTTVIHIPVAVQSPMIPAVPQGELPDIYYFILDGYGRADVLQDSYGYDNSEFLRDVRARGFFVPNRSRSNYSHTLLSLASSLNMTYLNDLGLSASKTHLPLMRMMQQNLVARLLKEAGYTTVAFQTGYSPTECHNADRYLAGFLEFNEFEFGLYQTTITYNLQCAFGGSLSPYEALRRPVRFILQKAPEVAQGAKAPCFVFAHILTPHPPAVFDAVGNSIEPSQGPGILDQAGTCTKQQYADQIKFINHEILQVVDKILRGSRRPAVIIIQGDHGPHPAWYSTDAPVLSDVLHQHMANLNAIYLPPGVRINFPETLTPVNTFRYLLDYFFHANLGPLEDRIYYSEKDPYNFQDVTQETAPK